MWEINGQGKAKTGDKCLNVAFVNGFYMYGIVGLRKPLNGNWRLILSYRPLGLNEA